MLTSSSIQMDEKFSFIASKSKIPIATYLNTEEKLSLAMIVVRVNAFSRQKSGSDVQGRAPEKLSPVSGPLSLSLYWWSVFLMCCASQFLAQLMVSQLMGAFMSSRMTQNL